MAKQLLFESQEKWVTAVADTERILVPAARHIMGVAVKIRNIWPLTLVLVVLTLALAPRSKAEIPDAPNPQPAEIEGTVLDVNDGVVPGATVVLQGPAPNDRRSVITNDSGFFNMRDVRPRVAYHVIVTANGFSNWTSPVLELEPGQSKILTDCKLHIQIVQTAVTVMPSEAIAVEQVRAETQQRVFGIVPNFYVVYDRNPEPLTAKLKFELALRVARDPVTIAAQFLFAGVDQAANRPDYQQGAKGYGQRLGAVAADGFSDILIGGAILPSLLHQDPRYFYQGTGTGKSRSLHAVFHPFVCRGDNGRMQPNYSSIGGDLASSALTNAYYPSSNRGVGLFLSSFAISTGTRVVSALAQEFVLGKLTHRPKQTH